MKQHVGRNENNRSIALLTASWVSPDDAMKVASGLLVLG